MIYYIKKRDVSVKFIKKTGVNIMTAIAEQVYQEAVNLNPIDRAELIEKLFSSFSTNKNIAIELNWKKEVSRRRSAYDKGDIPSDTIENVFERLGQR